MENIEEKLKLYNHYFSNLNYFILTENFKYVEKNRSYVGKIISKIENSDIQIDVFIQFNFPFSPIEFTTESIRGYPHLNLCRDGKSKFCLNTPFVGNLDEQLNLEMDRLKTWIETYFIQNKMDEHYDYILFRRDVNATMFFCEDNISLFQGRFDQYQFGQFELLRYITAKSESKHLYYANNLGNIASNWNITLKETTDRKTAYWVFVEKEPVSKKKEGFYKWSELAEYLFTDSFMQYFKEQIRLEYAKWRRKSVSGTSFSKKSNQHIKNTVFDQPLAIGYKIPSDNGHFEIHWELVFINYQEGRILEGISWAYTKNISESRFFGRGGFCKAFRSLSIMLVGLGAIGSSVAEILVRGGISRLGLVDGDLVDTGNICRSTYNLYDYEQNKASQLFSKLIKVSPFTDLIFYNTYLNGQIFNTKEYEQTLNQIKKYDLILDCTANNAVLFFLSNLELDKRIISIGITDKSSHLVCVSNKEKDSIYDKRNIILHSFGPIKQASFYEGAGCFYPTFEASFFDINTLINLAMRQINQQYLRDQRVKSFHLEYRDNEVSIVNYIEYIQSELNFRLIISHKCLRQIELHSQLHFPYEFGGVLMGGISENGKNVYVVDIINPSKYSNTRTYFKAENNDINKGISEIYEQSNGNIIYLGDWHSHPNMSNSYSNTDFDSIRRQANSDLVAINNPILAIVSIIHSKIEIGFYIYYDQKLFKFTKVEG